jgi:hypothetical protein
MLTLHSQAIHRRLKVEAISTQTKPNYQQITVDVPEDRVAEFHAFFARFLAGRPGRGHRGRYGRSHHGHHGHHGRHGHRCAERREGARRGEPTTEAEATGQQPGQATEL